jgi:hypothetical protein
MIAGTVTTKAIEIHTFSPNRRFRPALDVLPDCESKIHPEEDRKSRKTHTSSERYEMDMKLELVPIPVVDVDRAKAFCIEKMGFAEDVGVRPAEGVRVVQLTPPASMCSISIGTGGLPVYEDSTPGSVKGIHLGCCGY